MIRLLLLIEIDEVCEGWVQVQDLIVDDETNFVNALYCRDYLGTISHLLIFLNSENMATMINLREMRVDLFYQDNWFKTSDICYDNNRLVFDNLDELQDAVNSYLRRYFFIEEVS